MITFPVSQVQVTAVEDTFDPSNGHEMVSSLDEFENEGCQDILQASPIEESSIPSTNGFVHGVIQAYSRHHNLEIRPDDVWLAIMVQFGLYVNGNAEKLRSALVKHKGQSSW
ncbi:hypothetical protein LEN26_005444 [Aphanomyces euteiches]|nr:hypothetical protein LEN26_005444 [Aphanomyces euteiches]